MSPTEAIDVRGTALRAIESLPRSRERSLALQRCLEESTDAGIRARTVEFLCDICRDVAGGDEEADRMIASRIEDPDPEVRAKVTEHLLLDVPTHFSLFPPTLRSPDPAVWLAAARRYRKRGCQCDREEQLRICRQMLPLLDDPSVEVRSLALETIAEIRARLQQSDDVEEWLRQQEEGRSGRRRGR